MEDTLDEAFFIERALKDVAMPTTFRLCRNIGEAKAYLKGAGMYGNRSAYPMPDVLLLDLRLSEESGVHLLEWCRNEKELRDLPIIIVTRFASINDREECARLGANALWEKPLHIAELTEKLREAASTYCQNNSLSPPKGPSNA